MPNRKGKMCRDIATGRCITKDGCLRKLNKNKGHALKTPRKLSHDETGRRCIICKQFKSLDHFYKRHDAKRSYSSRCKECNHIKAIKGWANIMNLPPDQLYEYRKHLAFIMNRRNRKIKTEVLSHYSNSDKPQCANPFGCHQEIINDIDILTIDHINGNGNKQRKSVKLHGSFGLYRYLKRNHYPQGYQVLCANCQTKKAIVNKEHPRKYNHDMDLHTAVTS